MLYNAILEFGSMFQEYAVVLEPLGRHLFRRVKLADPELRHLKEIRISTWAKANRKRTLEDVVNDVTSVFGA